MRVFRLLLMAGVALYVFSRFIPCAALSDYPMADSLENGWTQALHVAFVKHLQFGTDIVFTYGPWGFLARGYHPQTYLIAVLSWGTLSIIFLCAGWRLASHFSNNRLLAGLWLVGFTAAASIPVGDDFNTRLAAWNALLLCLHFFAESRALTPVQILLVISLGWLDLVKFTGLVETAAIIAVIALENVFRQRRFPWIIPIWMASLVFFWMAAGQHLNLLGMFLANSWQITSGYTEAMMLDGKTAAGDVTGFLLIAGLLCSCGGWMAWKRRRHYAVLPLAGLGSLLFIAFKLGFVRNGWQHETTASLALVVVSLALLAVIWRGERKLAGAAVGLLMASVLFAGGLFHFWFPGNGLWRQFAGTFALDRLFAPVAASSTGYLRDQYEKNLADERRAFPLPRIQGQTDLYSYNQTILFAYGLSYQPRPIPQSYSAYTPGLAAMNSAHLRTASAATNILFSIQPIDGRFPALEDGCSWPELLTLYDLQDITNNAETILWFTRAAKARSCRLIPLQVASARFGEQVPLPALKHRLIWVEITLQKTLEGRLTTMFYKPPVLFLTGLMNDQTQFRFRLIPGMTAGGFLLSPLIADNRAFAALAITGGRKKLAGQEVRSLAVFAATETGTTVCYRTPLTIRFYELVLDSAK